MALNPATLSSSLAALFATYPAGAPAFATQFAADYAIYAAAAQSCAAVAPTVVNTAGLEAKVLEGIELKDSNPEVTYAEIAAKWSEGFDQFWTAGAFGASGLVTATGDLSSLQSSLVALWELQSATLTLFPASALQHALIVDAYTRTVEVQDTALPVAPGCGPAPIS